MGKESAFNAEDAGDVSLIPGLGSPSEEEMATHSSIFAWKIPGTEKPGGLQAKGLQRVGYARMANTIRFRDNINITVVTYYILKLKGKMSMIPLIDVKTVLTKCNTELFWWSSVDIPPASEGDMDSIPAPGRAHMPQRTGPRAIATELMHCKACEPQLLSPRAETTTETHHLKPVLHNRRSHCNEKPLHRNMG